MNNNPPDREFPDVEIKNESRPRTGARARRRPIVPAQVADVEDLRSYQALLGRLFDEYQPRTAIEEADLCSLAQLRWNTERLDSLMLHELNVRLRGPLVKFDLGPEQRLWLAYRQCLRDETYTAMMKHHLGLLKTQTGIAGRIEKWMRAAKPSAPTDSPKATRGSRKKRPEPEGQPGA
jgi:hypothetical protein